MIDEVEEERLHVWICSLIEEASKGYKEIARLEIGLCTIRDSNVKKSPEVNHLQGIASRVLAANGETNA